jgi:SlyX protein
MNAEVIERIELKIAFLERANTELSDVVYRQQRELQEMQTLLTALSERFETLKLEQTEYPPEDERPPHY